MTTTGRTTECSAKRRIAWGSESSTEVSRTYVRCNCDAESGRELECPDFTPATFWTVVLGRSAVFGRGESVAGNRGSVSEQGLLGHLRGPQPCRKRTYVAASIRRLT